MVNRSLWLTVVILLAGCTASPDQPSSASTQTSQSAASSSSVSEETDDSTALSTEVESDTTTSSVAPLRPRGEATKTTSDEVSTSAYISRIAMSDASIEMTWSARDDSVEYHLHRIPLTSEEKPGSAAMTDENVLHVATDIGRFVDETVEAGTQYWYGIRALDDDGALVAYGWHRADAVTDTEPPGLVKNLQANLDNGEVLVSWSRPDENYELHSFRVLRGVDGQELEQVSATWNIDQTSFVDDGPPATGTVTYAVVAMDFHWNLSDPAKVDIEMNG